MGIAALSKYGRAALRPLCDPGGIRYLAAPDRDATAEMVRAAVLLEAMFDPEAERSESTEFGLAAVALEPCLKAHKSAFDDLGIEPAQGDLFEAQGIIWRVDNTEAGGLGTIACWSVMAADVELHL